MFIRDLKCAFVFAPSLLSFRSTPHFYFSEAVEGKKNEKKRFKPSKAILPEFAQDMTSLQSIYYKKKDKIKFLHAQKILSRLAKLPVDTLLENSTFIEDLLLHISTHKIPRNELNDLTILIENASIVGCKNPDVWKRFTHLLRHLDFSYYPYKLSIIMYHLTTAQGVPITESLFNDLDQRFQQAMALNKDFLNMRTLPNILNFYSKAGLPYPKETIEILVGRLARLIPFLSLADKAEYLEVLTSYGVTDAGYVYEIFDRWMFRDIQEALKSGKNEELLKACVSVGNSLFVAKTKNLFEMAGMPDTLGNSTEALRKIFKEKDIELVSYAESSKNQQSLFKLLIGSVHLLDKEQVNGVLSKGMEIIRNNEKFAQNEPQWCLALYQALPETGEYSQTKEHLVNSLAKALMVPIGDLKTQLKENKTREASELFRELARSI